MRSLIDMDTIQIELTNACINSCSNCTRFCGHQKPYFITEEQFKTAFDSMIGYPKMTGFMGGEPLLHPQFEEFCKYAQGKIPREQLGLWTCFPKGYEYLNKVIADTFGNVFLNDHSRSDIFHCPILVSCDEIFVDKDAMWYAIDHCWIQNFWSATITPKGAFFCEIAGSMSILFDGSEGWPIESGWWKRTPKDFVSQMEEYCPKCGACAPLGRRRSIDEIDDISPMNYERLKDKSLKIRHNKYQIHDLQIKQQLEQMGAYKDERWRNDVARRFGMYFTLTSKGFMEPHIITDQCVTMQRSIFEQMKESFNAAQERQVQESV